MAEDFFDLSAPDRHEALNVAADRSGRPAHLLEKDVWVVWALKTLYASPLAADLVFKGGTSLSKAYKAIRRFSEDVDLTYDIRAIAPDLVADRDEALPLDRAEERRWSRDIRARLPLWVADTVQPIITAALAAGSHTADLRIDGEKLFINYNPAFTGSGYVAPSVMLEFGARSTGAPAQFMDITCDAAGLVIDVMFPTARPRVMAATRTFWEKATAIHVFCLQGRLRGERFARHWHDIVRLDDAGIAAAALADRALAAAVARHKAMFFPENAVNGTRIDYLTAISGGLQLTPDGESLTTLRDDYEHMLYDGLLLEDTDSFDSLMSRCTEIAARANAAPTVDLKQPETES